MGISIYEAWNCLQYGPRYIPDNIVHGANMGPIWVLSAPDGPHVGPMNFAIWDANDQLCSSLGTGGLCRIPMWLRGLVDTSWPQTIRKAWSGIYPQITQWKKVGRWSPNNGKMWACVQLDLWYTDVLRIWKCICISILPPRWNGTGKVTHR